MVDVKLDIAPPGRRAEAERISVPVSPAASAPMPHAAVRAIRAGAKEYIPLPPDAELIAAVLEAVAGESHAIVCRDPAMGAAAAARRPDAPSPTPPS